MRVQHTNEEKAERQRLEAILIDETKTEADRDFARERLQAIREDAVARAKVRAARCADYVEAKPADDDSCPKPTLEDCFGDEEEYRDALELWQLALNDRAAQKILDSPDSSHSARESAQRTIRKSAKRRKELDPKIDGSVVAPAVVVPSTEKVWISDEFEIGSEAYQAECRKHLHLNGENSLESLQRWYGVQEQWQRQHPESFKAECQRREKEGEERRRRNLEDHSGNPAAISSVVGKPFIASPLQKEIWQAQSEKFARQRGETVSPSSEPAVPSDEPPQHDVIFVLPDGFECYPDLTHAVPPFALGAKFIRVPSPPGYSDGDFIIAPGYVYDCQYTCWFRV